MITFMINSLTQILTKSTLFSKWKLNSYEVLPGFFNHPPGMLFMPIIILV